MLNEDIGLAIKQICEEKNISHESVIESLNYALASAYRKDYGEENQNIVADFDEVSGDIKVFDEKEVVDKDEDIAELTPEEREEMTEEELAEDREKRFNPKKEIQLAEAKKIKKGAKVGDVIRMKLEPPHGFGRVAAQTAKQVIIQRLKEAEKESLFQEFKDKEGTLVIGVIQQMERGRVLVDVNKFTALLPMEEQIRGERYEPGKKMKFLVLSVTESHRGPSVLLSRAHPAMVRELFTAEIPEIADGTVEIKAIARQAGSRVKVAVDSEEENVDPIGSCVGQRGSRVQTIISELGGEKVDIIQYDEDIYNFISNALSPAKISNIELNEETNEAKVMVNEDQLSLAIGKGGQNVRLASELTGWQIGIDQAGGAEEKEEQEVEKNNDDKEVKEEKDEDKDEAKEVEEKSDKKEDDVEETENKEEESEEAEDDNKEEAEDKEEK